MNLTKSQIIKRWGEIMAKDAYWFKHDSNARTDPKVMRLFRLHGVAGYGLYWIVIEMLRDAESYKLPIDSIPDICYTYQTDENIFHALFDVGLLSRDESHFYSDSLNQKMETYDEFREQRRVAGIRSGQKRRTDGGDATAQQPHSKSDTNERPTNGQEPPEEPPQKQPINEERTRVEHVFNERSTHVEHMPNYKRRGEEMRVDEMIERGEKNGQIPTGNNTRSALSLFEINPETIFDYLKTEFPNQKTNYKNISFDDLKRIADKYYFDRGRSNFKKNGKPIENWQSDVLGYIISYDENAPPKKYDEERKRKFLESTG
jgi:hypothetical protein